MPVAKLLMVLTLGIFGLVSCASQPQVGSTGSIYHDAAFNDLNRAPSSMTPPTQDGDANRQSQLHQQSQADYYFAMGEAQSFEGQKQKAIESFKMTLLYDPQSVAVKRRLAAEYLKIGFISEAIDQAEQAVKIAPKDIETRLLLGGLYSATKSYPKALEQYEEILKIDPTHAEAPLYMGAVWSELKQHEKAVKIFEALAKNPNFSNPHLAWYYAGRVRLEQSGAKYLKDAERLLQHALKIKPSHLDSVLALGSVYSQRKQEEKAIEFLSRFQAEQGPQPKIAEILSQHYLEKGDFDRAFEQLEILEKGGDDPLSAKLKMALILIDKKMYDEATRRLESILADAPDSDKVRFYLGAVYEETKLDDQAIVHFTQIPVDSPYYEEAVVHAAYLLKNQSRLEDALSIVKKAIDHGKDQPQIYSMQASLLDEKGRSQEAADLLTGALKKYPDNPQLHFYYGTIQDRLGNKQAVVSGMKKVIELDPNHVQGLNYLAYTWAEEGAHLSEAEKLARRAVELEPEDGYILDTLGWILLKKGHAKEAVKYLEAALRRQSGVAVIAEHLGDAYLQIAMVDRALEMYNRALEQETDSKKIAELRSKISSLNEPVIPQQVRSPASTPEK